MQLDTSILIALIAGPVSGRGARDACVRGAAAPFGIPQPPGTALLKHLTPE
jgi:hypothetical protein